MPRRIHHLNCATMCPAAGRIPGLMPRELVAHVLLIEDDDRLTLVDTGFGTDDVTQGAKRLGRPFAAMTGPALARQETALAQVEALGFAPGDVRDIVVTHLDLDHVGGIADFPHATIHVSAAEHHAAHHPKLTEKARYIAAQWSHGPLWQLHHGEQEDWFGFSNISTVTHDVLMVPLPGHSRGHSAIAVREENGHWLLHAGDGYFHSGDLTQPRSAPIGLKLFQNLMQADGEQREANRQRLSALAHAHSTEVTVFSAHDKAEFEALVSRAR